jgi:hypothetical protein
LKGAYWQDSGQRWCTRLGHNREYKQRQSPVLANRYNSRWWLLKEPLRDKQKHKKEGEGGWCGKSIQRKVKTRVNKSLVLGENLLCYLQNLNEASITRSGGKLLCACHQD